MSSSLVVPSVQLQRRSSFWWNEKQLYFCTKKSKQKPALFLYKKSKQKQRSFLHCILFIQDPVLTIWKRAVVCWRKKCSRPFVVIVKITQSYPGRRGNNQLKYEHLQLYFPSTSLHPYMVARKTPQNKRWPMGKKRIHWLCFLFLLVCIILKRMTHRVLNTFISSVLNGEDNQCRWNLVEVTSSMQGKVSHAELLPLPHGDTAVTSYRTFWMKRLPRGWQGELLLQLVECFLVIYMSWKDPHSLEKRGAVCRGYLSGEDTHWSKEYIANSPVTHGASSLKGVSVSLWMHGVTMEINVTTRQGDPTVTEKAKGFFIFSSPPQYHSGTVGPEGPCFSPVWHVPVLSKSSPLQQCPVSEASRHAPCTIGSLCARMFGSVILKGTTSRSTPRHQLSSILQCFSNASGLDVSLFQMNLK